MRQAKKVFATALSVALAGAFMVPTGALANNGLMNDTNTYYGNYGRIFLEDENAVEYWQMEEQYSEEREAALDALATWTQEAEDKIDAEYEAKCRNYQLQISTCIYSAYNTLARKAYYEKNGYGSYTASEWAEYDAENVALNTPKAVSGVSYNYAKNTLTLSNFKTDKVIYAYNVGNNFTIKVKGTCAVGGIIIDDSYQYNADGEYANSKATWGAGLAITGSGTLTVNKNKCSYYAISIETQNTAAALTVAKATTLSLYSRGDAPVVSVAGTNVASAKKALKLNGVSDGAKVTWAYNRVAYPLYKKAYAYNAREAAEGSRALDPNTGATGSYLLTADSKYVARVVKYHRNASTGKYVIDQWKVAPVTSSATTSDGGYDYDYDSSKAKRVADANGQPSGYKLTQVGTMPAGYSYDIADTEFTQYGKTVVVGKQTYTVKSTEEVYLSKAKNAKKVTVPATVKIAGKKFKVTGIAKKAFAKAKKAKTVTVKTKLLTKKSVKGAFKGSKVTTVKVPGGKVKKAYKEFMTKSVLGAKVTVK